MCGLIILKNGQRRAEEGRGGQRRAEEGREGQRRAEEDSEEVGKFVQKS